MASDYHEALLLRLRYVKTRCPGSVSWELTNDTGRKLAVACLWAAMTDAVHEGLGEEVKLILPEKIEQPRG